MYDIKMIYHLSMGRANYFLSMCYNVRRQTTQGMRRTILTIAIALAATSARTDAAPWQISRTVDEMTDEISYLVHTPGSVVRMTEYMSYRPELVVKVTPKGANASGGMKYVGDVYFAIETDGLMRGQSEVVTRFDREKPTTALWNTSTDRHAAFAPDWKGTIAKLSAATNLTVRYVTTLGAVRTATFDVSGLTNALKQVKSQYLEHTKK